ncbi:type III pantothenate kinase [Marinobacter vulgaris]|uniref:Type III pantothenate kinase n=1 Tax=Marinobacter vulgaris TaxID=1928331 RepID=A0A2V3ZJ84_9GAMM|nr:type III pantothenate kinase [Marinobacter vulgaris]PXX88362.1 type III pantothenate kinase [Marinobacter vulgaris]TSJ68196.1 type III pantothenate kinase [Marinobacter vulgaris]
MKLLIDAGNTRMKWQLLAGEKVVESGFGTLGDDDVSRHWLPWAGSIERIAISTVISEGKREHLQLSLEATYDVPVVFHWAESRRGKLVNAYAEVHRMGADRWHAMCGGWRVTGGGGFAVVDAGSAITVDYVASSGQHLGGYILPGKQMMLRSLQQDAARIGFDSLDAEQSAPGTSTTECVQHGLVWLREAMVARIARDCGHFGLDRTLVTGGDAAGLIGAGLPAIHDPYLVLNGLAAVDEEWALQ